MMPQPTRDRPIPPDPAVDGRAADQNRGDGLQGEGITHLGPADGQAAGQQSADQAGAEAVKQKGNQHGSPDVHPGHMGHFFLVSDGEDVPAQAGVSEQDKAQHHDQQGDVMDIAHALDRFSDNQHADRGEILRHGDGLSVTDGIGQPPGQCRRHRKWR